MPSTAQQKCKEIEDNSKFFLNQQKNSLEENIETIDIERHKLDLFKKALKNSKLLEKTPYKEFLFQFIFNKEKFEYVLIGPKKLSRLENDLNQQIEHVIPHEIAKAQAQIVHNYYTQQAIKENYSLPYQQKSPSKFLYPPDQKQSSPIIKKRKAEEM